MEAIVHVIRHQQPSEGPWHFVDVRALVPTHPRAMDHELQPHYRVHIAAALLGWFEDEEEENPRLHKLHAELAAIASNLDANHPDL
ncbi:MAG: hypothetical protein OXH49_05830 [Gemmatimonadetes bacterium]|nr:hypothetical protein [Gemmatimonadota bacterium]